MARWRLIEDHYIHGCPPDLDVVEWEYKETDRTTGREHRRRFKVPFFMDKGTIVCHLGKGQDGDTVFEGDPGPNMDPMDAEAKTISARCREAHPFKWAHPVESLPGQGFSESLLISLERKLDSIAAGSPMPVVSSGVSKEEFDELKAQLAALMAEKAEKSPRPNLRRSV